MKKIKVKVIKIGIKNSSEPDKRILYASFTPSIEYKGDERRKVSLNYPYYKNLKFKGRAHGMEDITNDDERHGANESKREESQGNYLWATAIANDMGSANYAATTGAGGASSNNTLMNCATPGDALGAGTIDLDLQYVHGTANDPEIISLLIHGDLA